MKKNFRLIAIVLSCAMLIATIPAMAASATSRSILLGDVNDNGVIEVEDAFLAMRHALNLIELDEAAISRADVNGDGVVNIADVNLICHMALELSGNN